MMWQLQSLIQPKTQANLLLKGFSLTRVPLLFMTGAYVKSINEQHCAIGMPFYPIVKNHLGSLYFGALAIGADACVGLLAAHLIREKQQPIQLVFKSFHADFLKRAEGRTEFFCHSGAEISEMIEHTLNTRERVHRVLPAEAICRNEKVADFRLELSLKLKNETLSRAQRTKT